MYKLLLCALCVAVFPGTLRAHQFTIAEVRVTLQGDSFEAVMTVDLDALALGVSSEEDDEKLDAALRAMTQEELADIHERLDRMFQRWVRIRFDDQPVATSVDFPEYPLAKGATEIPSLFGTTARLQGDIPDQAVTFSFSASRAFPDTRLTIVGPGGFTSDPIVTPSGQRGETLVLAEITEPATTGQTVVRYLRLGFWHILPEGLDHILFVLGLFLFCTRLWPLLWQVTAFTLAHTLTLALSTLDIFSLPSKPVEVLIALSILAVAAENIFVKEFKARRLIIVFFFGLLHGLGFAGVLGELGLPKQSFIAALISFNVGVEIGQLAVIGLAFLAVGWFRKKDWYHAKIVVPVSILIGVTSLFWVVERIVS